MTPEKLLLALEAGLKEPFAKMSLGLFVMAEEDDAMQLLCVSPTKNRAVLLCEEISVADTPAAQDSGIGDLTVRLIIQQPKGLPAEHGAAVWKSKGDGRLSLLELCTQARGYVQRCRFPGRTDAEHDHSAFRFLGQRPFRPDGTRDLRSQELTFRLTAALDWPAGEPINLTIP